jgi:hypothetical protein
MKHFRTISPILMDVDSKFSKCKDIITHFCGKKKWEKILPKHY